MLEDVFGDVGHERVQQPKGLVEAAKMGIGYQLIDDRRPDMYRLC